MLGKIARKLRSGRGASLLAALLLFLVCSVIGIVVLTAATAAAGRASKLAENDQRYFSVSSAAELLAQELSGKTVTINREKVTERTQTTNVYFETGKEPEPWPTKWKVTYSTEIKGGGSQPDDKSSETEGEGPQAIPAESGSAISLEGRSFLTELAIRLLFGSGLCNNDAAFERSFADSGFEGYAAEGSLEMKMNSAGLTELPTELQIEGKYWLRNDGMLFIELSNAEPGSGDSFTLVLTLRPEFSNTYKEKSHTEPPAITYSTGTSGENVTGYTEEETILSTETKTASVTWNVVGIGEKSEVGFDSEKAAGSGEGSTEGGSGT